MSGEYQAALNVLREERRRLADVRRQILADEGHKRDDPSSWQRLATQSRVDHDALARTIAVLEGVRDGRVLLATPDLRPWRAGHGALPQSSAGVAE